MATQEAGERLSADGAWPQGFASRFSLIAACGAVLLLFVMLAGSPARLDDWAWGSSLGLERMQSLFAGYNGRYLGNLCALALTRLPGFARATMELGVLAGICALAWRIMGRSRAALALFAVMCLAMPLRMFSQTISWTSGFANFVVSALPLLAVLWACLSFEEAPWGRGAQAAVLAVAFAGQLVLETATLCTLALAAFFLARSVVRRKPGTAFFAALLAVCLAGAALMFSNSAYLSAASGDGKSYKRIALLGSPADTLRSWADAFVTEISPFWLADCTVLCFFLAALALLLVLVRRPTRSRVLAVASGLFAGGILFDAMDGAWEAHGFGWALARALFYILFAVFLLLVAHSCLEGRRRSRACVIAGSQAVLVLPLLAVSPLGPRCLLHAYLFWALLAGLMLVQLGESLSSRNMLRVTAFEQGACCLLCAAALALAALGLAVQLPSWQVYGMRAQATQEALESGQDTIYLAEVPNAALYCFGANLGDDAYWLANYKRYYGIPQDRNVAFCPLERYLAGSCG